MYLEKRRVKNEIKYYLAHSFREGNKIHKIRKYLGSNLNKERLEERKEIAEKLILDEINQYNIIQDPINIKLPKKIINFVKNLEKKEKLRVFHLSNEQWLLFSELFTYNTNAIEGSELNAKEVKEILEKNIWPKRSKEDIAEAYGVNEAVNFVRKTKEEFSLDIIKKMHSLIFKNSKDFAGRFRKKGEEVVVRDNFGNIVHMGAPQPRIVSLLTELINWYENNKNTYPALILASVVHNQFENIHPFKDGNGRVGRLLLNYVLIKHSLPPVNINFRNRLEYYASLQKYEKEHNLKPTIDLLIKEYKELKKQFKK